jgi:pimeloyl-ACP methyl ester carboxylesterase
MNTQIWKIVFPGFEQRFVGGGRRGRSLVLFLLLGLAAVSCTHCPKSKYGDLVNSVPSQATKNDGVDLKGWTYEKVISEKSKETHYYYHFPSDDPSRPTFVFLHGLIFDGKDFLEFKPLADRFNLIAYDLPNQSSFYRGKTDDFAELLTDFLTTVKLEKIYLGGVSLGGQIAMIFASKKRPVEVEGLVLISTDIAKTDDELKKSKRVAERTAGITDREAGKTLCLVTKLVRKKKEDADGKMNALDHFVLRKVDFYNQVLDTAIDMKTPIPIRSITAPTLIIHGDADSIIDINDARGLVDTIPDATFEVIKGGEHTIAYAHAREIVRLIEDRFPTELAGK